MSDILLETESLGHKIRIVRRYNKTIMELVDGGHLYSVLKDDATWFGGYWDLGHLPMLLHGNPCRVLLIGLGGGTLLKPYLTYYPLRELDVAELDPQIPELARRFFDLPEDDRLSIHVREGRQYLKESVGGYDVVVVDAFDGERLPQQFTDHGFMELARQKLTEDGVLAVNTLLGWGDTEVSDSIANNMRGTFPHVYSVDIECNRLLVSCALPPGEARRRLDCYDAPELSRTIDYLRRNLLECRPGWSMPYETREKTKAKGRAAGVSLR